MDLLTFKILAMVLIFLSGLGGGLFPGHLKRGHRGERIFSYGSALAGGIFLGAGLIHMLPDAVTAFSDMLPHLDYPLAFLVAAIGFGLILFLEKGLLRGVEDKKAPSSTNPIFPYVLALALSVHSILAGVALGAEKTLLGGTVILVAIVAHKGSAAFALAVSFHHGHFTRSFITKIVIGFSLATPLGVVLGSLLTAWLGADSGRVFEAVFDALAAGSFLYISTLDIIREEFFEASAGWLKLTLVSLGLLFMAALALFL